MGEGTAFWDEIVRLRAAVDEFDRARPAAEALAASRGEPPDENAASADDEHAWDEGEVLAHVTEMLRFWLGEMERALDRPDGSAVVGRVTGSPIRARSIARDRSLPIRELFARLHVDAGRIAVRLGELDESAAAIELTQRGGERTTLRDFVRRTIVDHLEGHARQLVDTLPGR